MLSKSTSLEQGTGNAGEHAAAASTGNDLTEQVANVHTAGGITAEHAAQGTAEELATADATQCTRNQLSMILVPVLPRRGSRPRAE